MKTPTCTHHCRACGAHFSSLQAFDSHRQGPSSERYCEVPTGVVDRKNRQRLTPLSEHGECRIRPNPQSDVTIWTDAKGLARARTRFGEAA